MNITMNIGGTGKARKSSFSILTGLGAAKAIIVNPTNEEYKDITGREMPYPLTYDVRESNGRNSRLIQILCHNEEHNLYDWVKFYISEEDEVSKAGDKVHSMDPLGKMTYNFVDEDKNVDYPWFDAENSTPMKRGERQLQDFLQAYTKYDPEAPNANWRTALKEINCTADELFKGNFSGLQSLIEWAKVQQAGEVVGHSLSLLYTVRKTPKKDKETGEEIPGDFNYNQNINNRYFFLTDESGKVNSGAIKALKKAEEKQRKAGYDLTGDLYTWKLQQFEEKDCINAEVPSENQTPAVGVLDWKKGS